MGDERWHVCHLAVHELTDGLSRGRIHPTILEPSPNAMAYPKSQKARAHTHVSSTFFTRMLRVFLNRTVPASRREKPSWGDGGETGGT